MSLYESCSTGLLCFFLLNCAWSTTQVAAIQLKMMVQCQYSHSTATEQQLDGLINGEAIV